MTRRINRVLAALLVFVALPGWWLLFANGAGQPAARPLTIAQLRALAASVPGPAPTAILATQIGWRRVPGTFLAAGTGFKRRYTAKLAYRLAVPGSGGIVIDSGLDENEAAREGLEGWSARNQAMVEADLRHASLILLTHEHPDHATGLAKLAADPQVAAHAVLNPAQLPPAETAARLPWPQPLALAPRLDGRQPQAVAPGVVVIPAPSHTPGSQMIFVALQNGREYLFAGDIATLATNWQELRGRSQLVSQFWGMPEDRAAVFAWLATIRAFKASDPGLFIVPGHDLYALFDSHDPSGIELRDDSPNAYRVPSKH